THSVSPDLDSFPTRRSSDLAKKACESIPLCHPIPLGKITVDFEVDPTQGSVTIITNVKTKGGTGVEMEALSAASTAALTLVIIRSEEHTSELQSRFDLVCRL